MFLVPSVMSSITVNVITELLLLLSGYVVNLLMVRSGTCVKKQSLFWKPLIAGWTFYHPKISTLTTPESENKIEEKLSRWWFVTSFVGLYVLLFLLDSWKCFAVFHYVTLTTFLFFPLPGSAKRQSSILFTCDQSAGRGSPQLLSETSGCSAMFQWRTSVVCPPKKMECKLVSQHQTFDLRTLSSLTEPWKFSHRGDS